MFQCPPSASQTLLQGYLHLVSCLRLLEFVKHVDNIFPLAAGRQAISDSPQAANVLFNSLQSVNVTPLKDVHAQLRTVTALAKALAVFYSPPDESPRFPVLRILHWLLLVCDEYPDDVSRILNIFGSKGKHISGADSESS